LTTRSPAFTAEIKKEQKIFSSISIPLSPPPHSRSENYRNFNGLIAAVVIAAALFHLFTPETSTGIKADGAVSIISR
jgi:hypothetical protein